MLGEDFANWALRLSLGFSEDSLLAATPGTWRNFYPQEFNTVTEERLNRIETLLISLTETVNQRFETTERRFNNIESRLKTLELDMEPDGRISEAFERIVTDIDSLSEESSTKFNQINRRLDRLEHGQNQIKASLATILERLTGWSADQ